LTPSNVGASQSDTISAAGVLLSRQKTGLREVYLSTALEREAGCLGQEGEKEFSQLTLTIIWLEALWPSSPDTPGKVTLLVDKRDLK